MVSKRNQRIQMGNELAERALDRGHESPSSSFGTNRVSDMELFRKMGIDPNSHASKAN